ncbi:hypothetical protein AMTR_s00062p00154490 [Amborella trichopoda]|uniref:Myb/SANT-like domain-containing protein n=1 Tax=Amborella trichopoda TaxID=13333 RepID=U5DGT8_AMBTC|nr:hypothetical protein AMTR_s00062p00154490 [Amborella trichopoda]
MELNSSSASASINSGPITVNKGKSIRKFPQWTPKAESHFIELLVPKVMKGGGLRNDAWSQMTKAMKQLFGDLYDVDRLKSKKKWFLECHDEVDKLFDQSAWSYDKSTRMVQTKPELWSQFIASSDWVKKYRKKVVPEYFNDLEKIFGGGTINDVFSRARGGLTSKRGGLKSTPKGLIWMVLAHLQLMPPHHSREK